MTTDNLTTAEAATALHISRRRVNELIRLGTLKAERFGRDWQVDSASVEAYKNSPRRSGRKPKAERAAAREDAVHDRDWTLGDRFAGEVDL